MLLPDNLLDTTMTALKVLIILMIISHELMSDQQKLVIHVHRSTFSVSQITVSECHVMYFLAGPKLSYQLNVFFPWYVLMHKDGNKLNLNFNVAGLFLQETYSTTEAIRASM